VAEGTFGRDPHFPVRAHERDEPDPVEGFLVSDPLAGEEDGDVELLPVQAEAAAVGDDDVAAVEGVFPARQATLGP
jgi:hypothetical protein